MIKKVRESEAIVLCLRLLDIPSSTYYYYACKEDNDLGIHKRYRGLRKKIEKIIKKHPGYGHRRIKDALFKKEKIVINHKPLKKLLKIWGLKHLRKVKYPKPSPLAKHIKYLGAEANLVAKLTKIKLLEVILTDFTEIKCLFGSIHLILFSDMASKRIIGWNVSFHADTDNALKGYSKAKRYLKRMKINLNSVIVHQDQDTVFTGYDYAGTLLNDGISLSFTERGFKDNPFMESCIGHFKNEYKHLIQEARVIDETKDIIRKCVKDWNKERIHSVLKGRSPDEFIHTFCKLKKN